MDLEIVGSVAGRERPSRPWGVWLIAVWFLLFGAVLPIIRLLGLPQPWPPQIPLAGRILVTTVAVLSLPVAIGLYRGNRRARSAFMVLLPLQYIIQPVVLYLAVRQLGLPGSIVLTRWWTSYLGMALWAAFLLRYITIGAAEEFFGGKAIPVVDGTMAPADPPVGYCVQCGHPIGDDDIYCGQCGVKLWE